MRGKEQRDIIRRVVQVFGDDAQHLVFFGSCALALYARPHGHEIRTTTDADCVSTVTPWTRMQSVLAKLVSPGGPLSTGDLQGNHVARQSRYSIKNTRYSVDVLDLYGSNCGQDDLLVRAVEAAGTYHLDDGTRIRAVTPPFFLALKLVAFVDRAEGTFDRDLEDAIAVFVEVPDLPDRVEAAGLASIVQETWRRAGVKHAFDGSHIPDIVDMHIGEEKSERSRVIVALRHVFVVS